MNILYIIGNGLDIAYDMKTSYQDFFNYYLDLHSDDDDIRAMKKDIHGHRYETWADLEMGLGDYTSKCANKEIFLKCLSDIKDRLREYLHKESEKIKLHNVKSILSFLSIDQFLEPEPQSRYNKYRNQYGPNVSIDILTLNYTSTLESIFGYRNSVIKLSNDVILKNIIHVHGMLDNMMVMGVNDSSQISNPSFNTDLDVVEDFVKPEYNDACMNNKNVDCESLIRNANIIVLYGTSLGKSDEKWWKLIGNRMAKDQYPLLVYLPYDEKKNLAIEPNHLRRWTMEEVRKVRDRFDIKIDEQVLASRICIAFNKSLFSITPSITALKKK